MENNQAVGDNICSRLFPTPTFIVTNNGEFIIT